MKFNKKWFQVCTVVMTLAVLVLITVHPVMADLTLSPNVQALCTDVKTATNNFALFVRGIAAFIMVAAIIVGGILYKTSFGDSKKVTAAKVLFGVAIFGFVLIFEADKAASVLMGIFGFGGPGC